MLSLGSPLALLLAAAFAINYGPTPSTAAAHLFAPHVGVKRVNVVGAYATVHVTGAIIEGAPFDGTILLGHYAFGWQALDILEARCRLESRGLSPHVQRRLMQGMPPATDARSGLCEAWLTRDIGPARQVAAIRQQMSDVFVASVIISGAYAIAEWYGGGGGQTVFELKTGHWKALSGGGGAQDADHLAALGVPQQALCAFHLSDATCATP